MVRCLGERLARFPVHGLLLAHLEGDGLSTVLFDMRFACSS